MKKMRKLGRSRVAKLKNMYLLIVVFQFALFDKAELGYHCEWKEPFLLVECLYSFNVTCL